jgi:hypothetical protein
MITTSYAMIAGDVMRILKKRWKRASVAVKISSVSDITQTLMTEFV